MKGVLPFIIFGLKRRDADAGPAYPVVCHHCNNTVYMHAYAYRSWFHIFWIPLIPWRKQRFAVCPICNCNIKLEKTAFKQLKELVMKTEAYEEHQLSDDEYNRHIEEFEAQAGFTTDERFDLPESEDVKQLENADQKRNRRGVQ